MLRWPKQPFVHPQLAGSYAPQIRSFPVNAPAPKAAVRSGAELVSVLRGYPQILRGEMELTTFAFDYMLEAEDGADPAAPPLSLRFVVMPGKKPPMNVHGLIGRNCVGKTRILAGMADALESERAIMLNADPTAQLVHVAMSRASTSLTVITLAPLLP